MKILKWIGLSFILLPGLSWAGLWGNSGGVDYSNSAGSMFYCASTGTFSTQAGLSITTPVISLYNPTTSNKNLVIDDVGITITAAPAAAAGFMLAFSSSPVNPNKGTISNGTITPALIGKSTTTANAICLLDANLPNNPVAFRYLGGTTGAAAISGVNLTDQTQGKVVIPPGYVVSIQATSAASILADILWTEVQ